MNYYRATIKTSTGFRQEYEETLSLQAAAVFINCKLPRGEELIAIEKCPSPVVISASEVPR